MSIKLVRNNDILIMCGHNSLVNQGQRDTETQISALFLQDLGNLKRVYFLCFEEKLISLAKIFILW